MRPLGFSASPSSPQRQRHRTADLLANEEPSSDAQRQRRQDGTHRNFGQIHAGIGKAKFWHDREANPWSNAVFQADEWQTSTGTLGVQECTDNACNRGMDA